MKLHEVVKVKIHQTQVSSAGDFTHTPNFGSEILAPVSGKAAKPLGFLGVFFRRNMEVSRDDTQSHHGFQYEKRDDFGMFRGYSTLMAI